ncbi:type I-F CRISPR-associated protein Csy1 [Marinobacterium rhizophilum]|uniref:type I-F CRISPR-associated protein Csy1 n=1 Tax=Marinobacterium rhizophilum TaxID=420402 RepID=UPI0003760DBD|nr:type I-F CRISPR-associated protein Csy1 [Marinobacterium rhizophilum]
MDDINRLHTSRKTQLQAVINGFLQERLQVKLEKLKDGAQDERQKLLEKYQPDTWIPDAAKRVGQIQQVTHAIKFTHPDARGSSFNQPGNPAAGDLLVGTQSLGADVAGDVVGNAAALDVYKFLRLQVNGQTLLELASHQDSELQAAFSDDAEQAQSWMAAFAGLVQSKGQASSHKLAKQLYWPLAGGNYHLLAPLFPTALVHRAWQTIREDRFSDTAKAARAARRAGESYSTGYREYPDLAIQNFGGTKPQNISQLNSERFGENYLLRSVPPNWRSDPLPVPLYIESVFERLFSGRTRVRELGGALAKFLRRASTANNLRIRETRAGLVGDLCNELLLLAAELQALPAGWSRHQDCRLNSDEQCWLDPQRAGLDADFAAERSRGEWQLGISRRFGNWLNARLNKAELSMGQAEAQAWQSVVEQELRMIRMELEADD